MSKKYSKWDDFDYEESESFYKSKKAKKDKNRAIRHAQKVRERGREDSMKDYEKEDYSVE